MEPVNFRPDQITARAIEDLVHLTGLSKSSAIRYAITRMRDSLVIARAAGTAQVNEPETITHEPEPAH